MKYNFRSKLSNHFIEFIEERERCGYSPLRINLYLEDFDKFMIAGRINDSTLNKETVLNFLASLQEREVSASYFNSFVGTIRIFAMFLISQGVNAFLIPTSYYKPKEEPHIYVPSAKEIEIFIKFVDKIKARTPALKLHLILTARKIIIRLLYLCGLRISEAIKLKRIDIDFKENTLYIRHSKGDNDRIVGFDPIFLKPILEKYDEKAEKFFPSRTYFFESYTGEPIDSIYFRKWFKKTWRDCFPSCSPNSIPTPHSLRHSFVVHRIDQWVAEGKDLKNLLPYLSKYLGHSSIEQTWYYYHSHLNHTQAAYHAICENTVLGKEILNELFK